ncbi:MAG TPA: hypothetical protein VGQ55_07505 [Pyrinomonadaceae bacterium]|nr:hypothetical protein [Pyrinomonadaceae bacterium]
MRSSVLPVIFTIILVSTRVFSQSNIQPSADDRLDQIAKDVARTSTAVETLNRNFYTFFKTLSTDTGGAYFSDRQKRLLFSLEVLNRYEQSLANAQRLRLDLIEKQSKMRLQLAGVTDDLRPESLDRFTAWRGTTDAEGVRDIRRTALQKEQRELTAVLTQIANDLSQSSDEIRRSELQIRSIRARILGEIDKEMAGQ